MEGQLPEHLHEPEKHYILLFFFGVLNFLNFLKFLFG